MAKENNKTITGLELKFENLLIYLIPILGFIFAFMKNEKVSSDARYHYKQAGATFIVYAAVAVTIAILGAISVPLGIVTFGIVSVILWIINGMLYLIDIAVVVFVVITLVKGFHGIKFEIPVVNKLGNTIWK